MAVVPRLDTFDDLFAQNEVESIVVNDFDPNSKEDKQIIDDLVMRQDSGDTISLLPSCLCGELKGVSYIGMTCECGTIVESPIDEEYNWSVWLRQPEGVARLIHPYLMQILRERYTLTNPTVNIIDYVMTHHHRFKDNEKRGKNYGNIIKLDNLLKTHGIERGYNSFVENFNTVIDILENNGFSKGSKAAREETGTWLKEAFEHSLSEHIPIPNKAIFVMDTSHTGTYIDRDMIRAVSVVRSFTGIDVTGKTDRQKQDKVAKGLAELGGFFKEYYKNIILGKPGLIRKHMTRTRSHFTLRAVVTSIVKPHRYDEIETPWSASMSLLREHILAELMRRNFSLRKAIDYFMKHINKYSALIDDIFKKIIRDAGGGIPCLLNRNPSLHRGSIIFVRIREVKSNVLDPTMSVSYLLSPTFNMD